MKIRQTLIDKLLRLQQGGTVAASGLPEKLTQEMLEEQVIVPIVHGRRTTYRIVSPESFQRFLALRHDIHDLQVLSNALANSDSRAALVEAAGDSKYVTRRAFYGFPVNCYEPLPATMHGQDITLQPQDGMFTYVADYEAFRVPEDYIIIGIENSENFRRVGEQRAFFEREVGKGKKMLFVSRYPQNGDLVKWLCGIKNRYVHFGDLDLAGVHIYLSEYFLRLGQRASFLIPSDYEQRLQRGSRERYDIQLPKYQHRPVADWHVRPLLDAIYKYHRGYDQEGFIEG